MSRDIERSRHFAKTLRQTGEQRLWTAKYNNVPRYGQDRSSESINLVFIFVPCKHLGGKNGALYESAPDLLCHEYQQLDQKQPKNRYFFHSLCVLFLPIIWQARPDKAGKSAFHVCEWYEKRIWNTTNNSTSHCEDTHTQTEGGQEESKDPVRKKIRHILY